MNKSFQYSGRDNLDAMSLAKNYNHYIYNWLNNGIHKKHSVLDFGSGQGEFFYRFKRLCNNTIAIEPDLNMKAHYKNGDVYDSISGINQKFNLIYSVNVLEHIYDDKSVVNSFKQLLCDDDAIVRVFVPARQELFSAMDKKVGHYRRYSKTQLENLFLKNGYRIESCRYFDFLGYFAALVYKYTINKADIDSKSLIFYDKYIFPLSLFFDKFFSRFLGKNLLIEATLINNKK